MSNLLDGQGRAAEAEAAYRQTLKLRPDLPEAHCNLGHLLKNQGRFAEALVELRRGHELGSRQPGWNYPSGVWVGAAEQLAAVERRLPDVLRGDAWPDPADLLALVIVCRAKRMHAAATRFVAAALAADPRRGADPANGVRYSAACTAVLAATGRGADSVAGPTKLLSSLRRQALAWLGADLAAWRTQAADTEVSPAVRQRLQRWQSDPDLAGVRDVAELAKLPGVERAAWERIWADVADLAAGRQPALPGANPTR